MKQYRFDDLELSHDLNFMVAVFFDIKHVKTVHDKPGLKLNINRT